MCGQADLEDRLARATTGENVGSGDVGSASRDAAVAADMIASLRQVIRHGEVVCVFSLYCVSYVLFILFFLLLRFHVLSSVVSKQI